MSEIDQPRRGKAHLIYAFISFASPFAALGVMLLYQHYADPDLGTAGDGPLDDAEINSRALFAFAVIIELFMAVMVGCVIGLVFASLSIFKRRRYVSFGTAAFMFNVIPIFLLLWRLLAG